MWKSNIWNECDYEQDAVRIRTAVNAGLGRVMQFSPSTFYIIIQEELTKSRYRMGYTAGTGVATGPMNVFKAHHLPEEGFLSSNLTAFGLWTL